MSTDRREKIKLILWIDQKSCQYCHKGYASMTDAEVVDFLNKNRSSISEEIEVGPVTESEIHRARIIMDRENAKVAEQHRATNKARTL